jgi:hypothetical protein
VHDLSAIMADLEELAIKRDRGYLLRLVLLLTLGLGASFFLWNGLTGHRTSGCLANAFLGQEAPAPNTAEPAPAAEPQAR